MSIFEELYEDASDPIDEKISKMAISKICKLPIREGLTQDTHDTLNEVLIRKDARDDGFSLFPIQAEAIAEYCQFGGGFFPICAGGGKTLISILIASEAFRHSSVFPDNFCEIMGAQRTLLIIPAQVHIQLTKADLPLASRWSDLCMEITDIPSARSYKKAAECGKNGLYIVTSSLLSVASGKEIINLVKPDLIIIDEAHEFANPSAGRTKRLKTYMDANPETNMVAMSGTITRKQLRDYNQLLLWTLKDRAPTPGRYVDVEIWNRVISSSADKVIVSSQDLNRLLPLYLWARENFPSEVSPKAMGFRQNRNAIQQAFHTRLKTTQGVVISSSDAVGTSITFSKEIATITESETELIKAVDDLETLWVSPNGDEIDSAFTKFRHLNELSNGFYHKLHWNESHPKVEQAKEKFEVHQDYNKMLREFFKFNKNPQFDTPFMVAKDMSIHGAANVNSTLYNQWKLLKGFDSDLPDRLSTPIWISEFKLTEAIEILKKWKGKGGIVWTHFKTVGVELFKRIEAEGMKVTFCPAGANEIILNAPKDHIIVASISGHGTGKNLARYQRNLYFEGFKTATLAEQSISRTHRPRQLADTLDYQLLMSTGIKALEKFEDARLAGWLLDAFYVHNTMSRQKLITGSWSFQPQILNSEELRDMGLDNSVGSDVFEKLKNNFTG